MDLLFGARFADGIEVPAEVPLAEAARAVALFLEHLGDSEILRLEDCSTKGSHDAVEATPVVLPGQKSKATGRTDSRGTVPIGEGHSLRCQSVEVGCLDLCLASP